MRGRILDILSESLRVQNLIAADAALMDGVQEVVEAMITAFQSGGKVLFCGNGGSAADAQHLAAELSGRFYLDRRPLFAEALHVNTSFLTAVANDFGYDRVYARAVEAMGRPGDVLVALSTSGKSPNVVLAALAAQAAGMKTVAMTGQTGGDLASACDYSLKIPSLVTPRIQEGHILLGHIICELVEHRLFAQ